MILGTRESLGDQVGYHVLRRALVKASATAQHIDNVKLLEEHGARLVDGADNGASLDCKELEQRDALSARRTVQTPTKRYKHG